jgi:homoaconitate hydratase
VTEPEANKQSLDTPKPAEQALPEGEKVLTRRTGWTLTLDLRRSKVTVKEGENGEEWSQKVGEVGRDDVVVA